MAFVAGQAFVNRLFARREVGRTTALGRKPALPERAKPAALDVLHAYGRLLKLRIVLMVLVSCAIGLVLASGGHVVAAVVGWTLLGTALLAGGACALNQYQERELDARMERTRHRPLPAGLLDPRRALVFSIALLVAGGALLAWRVNLLTALLGFLTALLYNFVYTPMKRRTWLNTPMGAIPGAIPPMMGWAAATGRLDAGAWLLFVMVFLWQHVHFYAIAWLFRDDYRRAGFRMLPTVEGGGDRTFHQLLFAASALIPVSLLLAGLHLTGPAYFCGAVVLGAGMLAAGIGLFRSRSLRAAHVVMWASIAYLPLLLGAIVLDLYL